jgi:phosphoserine aminotransferase
VFDEVAADNRWEDETMNTLGPWRINDNGDGTSLIDAKGGADIADTRAASNEQAIARLIAASPAFAKAWSLVPREIREKIFDVLHTPEDEWVEAAIRAATE